MNSPLIFLALLVALPVSAETIHVFLEGGQSNADGRASTSDLPTGLQSPQTNVQFYYSSPAGNKGLNDLKPLTSNGTQFGPEITFGRDMATYYGSTGGNPTVAIIKYAAGGTSLYSGWAADGTNATTGDGTYYKNFQHVVDIGLAALASVHAGDTLEIEGMIWMQGETDAQDQTTGVAPTAASDYGAHLTTFIADVRATYGADLPFVIGSLSTNQTYGGLISAANLQRVIDGQHDVASTVTGAAIVETQSYTLKTDGVHFDAVSQQALGSAFATAMQSMVPVPELSTFSLFAGLGVFGFSCRRRPRHCGASA